MLNSLYIKNFKCLKEIQIDNLSGVNLIAGKNNTGKSSLLEAAFIYANKGYHGTLFDLSKSRGEECDFLNEKTTAEMVEKTLCSFFSERKTECSENNTILFEVEHTQSLPHKDSIKLSFMYYRDIVHADDSGNSISYKQEIVQNEHPDKKYLWQKGLGVFIGQSHYIFPITDRKYIHSLLPSQATIKSIYIHSNEQANASETNAKRWDAIALTEKEDIVINALKIIEPEIEQLRFIEDERSIYYKRIPVVKLKNSSTRYPLGSMGDGINHIFTIILAMVNVENGILLIDEIENGLHYTTQELLWNTIFKLSKELNIQVFATTHSDDCINSFGKILNEKDYLQGQLIRLEKRNENIRAVNYDTKELDVIYKQGIEVR